MSTGSFGCVIQTALIHASVHPSSRADCPLKRSGIRMEMLTALLLLLLLLLVM